MILMLLAGSLFVFSGCTKTGPPGPQGIQGVQGNANVVGSDAFSVGGTTWAFSTADNAFYASFTNPDITAAVSNHGTIEVFLYYPGDQTWRSLPDIYGGTQFYTRFSTGGFEIYFANVDGSTPANPGNQTFRMVVIAPSQKQAHPNTNWKNYNEAMSALNNTVTSAAAQ